MVNKIDLLSDGEFKELVNNSSSVSDVLRNIGYSTKGNSWGYTIVKERMSKLNITFGKKINYNVITDNLSRLDKGKVPLSEVLIEHSSYNRTSLKQRLVEEGLKEYKCECCGISNWQDKFISLQLHHINGVSNDNRLENLQLLCPNCHSQTENFSTKGEKRVVNTMCDNLPVEDKKKIMQAVRELGIVEARKQLTYRNSLINSVVKSFSDKIVMICPNRQELEFTTMHEASEYLFTKYGIGSNPKSSRTGIGKCCNGKQDNIQGFKFKRVSAEL